MGSPANVCNLLLLTLGPTLVFSPKPQTELVFFQDSESETDFMNSPSHLADMPVEDRPSKVVESLKVGRPLVV